jgi:hypothetical protein
VVVCSEKSQIRELAYTRVVVVLREFTSQFTHTKHTMEGMFVSTLLTVLWGVHILNGFIFHWKMYLFLRNTVVCWILHGFWGWHCMLMRHGTNYNQWGFSKHVTSPQGLIMLHWFESNYCHGQISSRFEVFTAMTIENVVICNVIPCSLLTFAVVLRNTIPPSSEPNNKSLEEASRTN